MLAFDLHFRTVNVPPHSYRLNLKSHHVHNFYNNSAKRMSVKQLHNLFKIPSPNFSWMV